MSHGGYSEEVVALGAPDALGLNWWHHVVGTITRNATSTEDRLALYVDGTPVNTRLTDKIFGVSLGAVDSALTIGSLGSSFGFKGSIDEVALYRTALTLGQVQAHYNAAITVPEPATLVLAAAGVVLQLLACGWRKRRRQASGALSCE